MRHLANLKDLSGEDIQDILAKAAEIKQNPGDFRTLLAHESLAMIFQKTSTRTRISFEVAMTELGGHSIYIDWATSNFVLSGIEYETEYLSRNVSSIMARLLHHSDLEKIIAGSQVPVINGCCERYHPCQALTDILTMQEHHDGDIRDARLTYVGVQNNVSNSLCLICDKLGIQLTLATPEPDDNGESQDADVREIIRTSANVNHTTDVQAAAQDTDFIYTDTWIDMQYFINPDSADEKAAVMKRMLPYQINRDLLEGSDCRIMHDMPIHDDYEITAEMVRDPRSIIFPQAANRLHAQKGLLWWIYQEAGNL
ncbi:MAG: ornithine carbamoyltransferase [Gammaproteobacteria bacterium]|jgi:ornithine carbamoyltransferase|nr:ornithine carbamoyltransferase [Gammaproteobacteria bacterium]|tara:strand:+ start:1143 stop:2078 length:936 start_codon:yes stop_codon:yes gene_type:complete